MSDEAERVFIERLRLAKSGSTVKIPLGMSEDRAKDIATAFRSDVSVRGKEQPDEPAAFDVKDAEIERLDGAVEVAQASADTAHVLRKKAEEIQDRYIAEAERLRAELQRYLVSYPFQDSGKECLSCGAEVDAKGKGDHKPTCVTMKGGE